MLKDSAKKILTFLLLSFSVLFTKGKHVFTLSVLIECQPDGKTIKKYKRKKNLKSRREKYFFMFVHHRSQVANEYNVNSMCAIYVIIFIHCRFTLDYIFLNVRQSGTRGRDEENIMRF